MGYVTNPTDKKSDNRIDKYSYILNGLTKMSSVNTYDDAFKRLTQKIITIGNTTITQQYNYDGARLGGTNHFITSSNESDTHVYMWDRDAQARTTVEYDYVTGGYTNTYEYDSFGQLVRENNKALDKTLIYCYDNNGNVTNVQSYGYTTADTPTGTSSQNIYTYDSIHKDRLTGVKLGSFTTPLSYNSIGYPITYGNKRFEWDNGRLVSYYDEGYGEGTNSTESFEFTYNAYGQRTVKEYSYYPGEDYYDDYVTGSTTTYDYDSSGRLIREYCVEINYASSNTTREFIYLYDETGIVGAMYSYNGGTAQPYYYHRNQRGDVVAIYDSNGIKRAEYAYDAFGNCKIISSSNNDLANKNPIRYRGYYYDYESGFYYLNARYYNPVWRRFISPDSTEYLDPQTINGLNQYAYCNNDPINYVDPSGHLAFWAAVLIGVGILGTVGFGATAYEDYADDGEVFNDSIGADAYLANTLITGALGALGGGLSFAFAPVIARFLGSSFTLGSYALASGEIAAITLSGAQIAGGALAATATFGLMAYESKKSAPRIKSNTRKEAYDKAFYKGGKKKPILHWNGKYGPHYHPANLKFKHWHYYFAYILGFWGIYAEDFE